MTFLSIRVWHNTQLSHTPGDFPVQRVMGSQILFLYRFSNVLLSLACQSLSLSLLLVFFCEYSQMDNQPGLRIHANIRPEQPARISFKAVKVDFPSADISILVHFLLSFFFPFFRFTFFSPLIEFSSIFSTLKVLISLRTRCTKEGGDVDDWACEFELNFCTLYSSLFFSDSLSHVKFHFLFVMLLLGGGWGCCCGLLHSSNGVGYI